MPYFVLLLLGGLFVWLSISRATARQRAVAGERWADLERQLSAQDESLRQLDERLGQVERALAETPRPEAS